MKKLFETPEMNVACFDVENIITDSTGGNTNTTSLTAVQVAQSALTEQGYTKTVTLAF